MRFWTLVLAVLSFVGGVDAEAVAGEEPRGRVSAAAPSVGGVRGERAWSVREERARSVRGVDVMGARVEGERFLVWDENPEEAAAWGSELARVDAKAADSRWPVLCAWCGSRCNEAPVEGSSSICPDCLARHFEEDPGTA